MLYYVKSGDISSSVFAKTHKQAAIKTINSSRDCPGVFVVVNEKEIIDKNMESNVYFCTDDIVRKMRLVG